ncbi:hypothetical protein [Jeotgalibacillus soli]|uniref:Uncharacterized protein n=1 Tax=Jeotgalibacillus soli TaxID=889306 RepID=A0A0C2S6Y5_9BACL|nr:hypothetical protein [Jeotgalibacillus soli]KIL49799.1 hypothetical protein KP78_12670 [Jeotgalibacillus soli]
METQKTTLTHEQLSVVLEQAYIKGSNEEITMNEMVTWLIEELKNK